MPPSAFDSALLGEVFGPADAVRAGYLDRASTDVLRDAAAIAQRLSGLRRGAVARTKEHARAALALRITETLYADMATLAGPTPP
jgi:enoyl-CoA hydratase/carnithine racemase